MPLPRPIVHAETDPRPPSPNTHTRQAHRNREKERERGRKAGREGEREGGRERKTGEGSRHMGIIRETVVVIYTD